MQQPLADGVDHVFKILLIGDSGVGKSSLLQRFTTGHCNDQQPTTIGVDFGVKQITVYNKKIKLMVWDTAGQEKFRTLTSTFYRGAKGVILVFDVTREGTLKSLEDYWLHELDTHAASMEPVKMVVANKTDMDKRQVTWHEGMEFAKLHGCLFVETSAKSGVAVTTAFEELVLKILESPVLMADDSATTNGTVHLAAGPTDTSSSSACYC